MKFVDRVLNLIGFEEEEEEIAVHEATPQGVNEERQRRRTPLVSLPGTGLQRGMHMVVVDPLSFDEVRAIADQVKGRRPVILNLEGMEKETAQKILNFLSGAVYALDGRLERVGTGIFLVAPANVEVERDEPPKAEDVRSNFFGG